MPPANDNFADAEVISGASGSVGPITIDDATTEVGEPTGSNVVGGIHQSIWFEWTCPADASYAFDTHGSTGAFTGVDTTLAVWTGATLGALVEVASNDDDPSGLFEYTSRVVFDATAGTVYRIQVGTYADGITGGVLLHWGSPTPPPPPETSGEITGTGPSDTCDTAWTLTSIDGIARIDNTGAGSSSPDVFSDYGFSATTNRMWFKYTAPRKGLFQASALLDGAGSIEDLDIGIWVGSCADPVSPDEHPTAGPNFDDFGTPLTWSGVAYEFVAPYDPPDDQPVDYSLELGQSAWVVIGSRTGMTPGRFRLWWRLRTETLTDRFDNWPSGLDVIEASARLQYDYIRHNDQDWQVCQDSSDIVAFRGSTPVAFPALDASVTQRPYATLASDGTTLWCVAVEKATVDNPFYCIGSWPGFFPAIIYDVDYLTWSPMRVAVFRYDATGDTWVRDGMIDAATSNSGETIFGDYEGDWFQPRAAAHPSRPDVLYVCWGEEGHQGAAVHRSTFEPGGTGGCADLWCNRLVLAAFGASAPFGEVELFADRIVDSSAALDDPYHLGQSIQYATDNLEILSGTQTRLFLSPTWQAGGDPLGGRYDPTITEAQLRCHTVNDDGTLALQQTITYEKPLATGWQDDASMLYEFAVEPIPHEGRKVGGPPVQSGSNWWNKPGLFTDEDPGGGGVTLDGFVAHHYAWITYQAVNGATLKNPDLGPAMTAGFENVGIWGVVYDVGDFFDFGVRLAGQAAALGAQHVIVDAEFVMFNTRPLGAAPIIEGLRSGGWSGPVCLSTLGSPTDPESFDYVMDIRSFLDTGGAILPQAYFNEFPEYVPVNCVTYWQRMGVPPDRLNLTIATYTGALGDISGAEWVGLLAAADAMTNYSIYLAETTSEADLVGLDALSGTSPTTSMPAQETLSNLTRIAIRWNGVHGSDVPDPALIAYQGATDLSGPFIFYDGSGATAVVGIQAAGGAGLSTHGQLIWTDRFSQTWLINTAGSTTRYAVFFFDRRCTNSWVQREVPWRLHPALGGQLHTTQLPRHLHWDETLDTIRIAGGASDFVTSSVYMGTAHMKIRRLGQICKIGPLLERVTTHGLHIWQRYSCRG